jgi:serine protease AprX
MKPKLLQRALIVFLIAFPPVIQSAPLRKCLDAISKKDSACSVWVVFSDKPAHNRPGLSSHALMRRAKAGFPSSSASDGRVSMVYVSEIERMGGKCRNIFKWANAASFSIAGYQLKALSEKPFVKDLIPVRSLHRRLPNARGATYLKKSRAIDSTGLYGPSFSQLNLESIPPAHRMIAAQLNKPPGDGIIVGIFDSGFRLNHKCFNYVKTHQAIMADSDFVEHKRDVSDPDSVRRIYHELGQSPPEEHGSWTLSLIAGLDSGNFAGVAWGAKFVLAKTEWADRIIITPGKSGNDTNIAEIEIHAEEDNWAAAMVWAESLGVDIVSSSLGYSNGFTDSLGNLMPRDDYTYADMNGSTTIISKAAKEAAARGMIIVNAVGNEGPDSGTMDAPADVKDVISVGGVNPDKSITDFSSRGPTFDGRIKPDCAAQATEIYAPDIYSSDSAGYEYGLAGTSFSTPMVAGICALILQTHVNDSAALIRERLYASCAFAPTQIAVDNSYGRGIPNALTACQSSAAVLPGAAHFALYPNVLDIVHKSNQFLTVKFIAAPDASANYSQTFIAAVRTIDGRLIWGHSEDCVENQPVSLKWPQNSKAYAPGMYYFVITYRGKSYSRKFLILG